MPPGLPYAKTSSGQHQNQFILSLQLPLHECECMRVGGSAVCCSQGVAV